MSTHEEYEACVALQRLTWGPEYDDCVPASLLKVTQRVGGISAGAFDEAGRMIGFVYGLTGVERGRLVHWSHMLAVRQEYRNRGVGRLLKEFQRAELRGMGVEVIYWTFDPLVERNAHLNLNRLGARVVEYVVDMYAPTGSPLHDFGTDRFVVAWPVEGGAGEARDGSGAGSAWSDAETWPVVNVAPATGPGSAGTVSGVGAGSRDGGEVEPAVVSEPGGGAGGGGVELGRSAPGVRIEVPVDVEGMGDVALARAWRASTRAAFLEYLGKGYEVAAFRRIGDRCFYLLTAPGEGSASAA